MATLDDPKPGRSPKVDLEDPVKQAKFLFNPGTKIFWGFWGKIRCLMLAILWIQSVSDVSDLRHERPGLHLRRRDVRLVIVREEVSPLRLRRDEHRRKWDKDTPRHAAQAV